MPPFLEYRRNENEKSTILPDEERKMCAMHALMNANQIIENGGEAKINMVPPKSCTSIFLPTNI